MTNQQKCLFPAVSLYFCLPFGFVFIRMRSWEFRNSRTLSEQYNQSSGMTFITFCVLYFFHIWVVGAQGSHTGREFDSQAFLTNMVRHCHNDFSWVRIITEVFNSFFRIFKSFSSFQFFFQELLTHFQGVLNSFPRNILTRFLGVFNSFTRIF